MKNLLLYSLLAVTMLIATALRSAEIIPVWNKTINGDVQDIKFMPGNGDQFMLTTGLGEIQIRNSENGELIKSHIDSSQFFMNGYFEFTPDSNRLVMAKSGLLQLVDLKTFERLNYFAFGKDAVIKGFDDLVIDPIRPYVYVTVNGYSRETGDPSDIRSKVQVYNYETMKLVKDLTPYGEYNYTAIAVSDDGKYLATLNDNKTYLKVWDLQSMEQIIKEPLYDPNSKYGCEAQDIYFSKINPDVIYYSGKFSKLLEGTDWTTGDFSFFISNKEKRRLVKDGVYAGHDMIFLSNETKIFNSTNGVISVLNLLENMLEYYGDPDSIYKSIVRYNRKSNYFIGAGNNKISKFLYDGITQINQGYDEEITISPNPTGSFVNISLNCTEPQINYQINNSNGLLLLQNSVLNQGNSLQIDFSTYPVGVYFLTLNCNNHPKTYKIIKEG